VGGPRIKGQLLHCPNKSAHKEKASCKSNACENAFSLESATTAHSILPDTPH